MLETSSSYRGMVVAPHRLAAQAGLRVLQDGGNAIEAMVAAASAISVVYPHMNSIGGDNFWLISKGGKVWGVESCGAAGAHVTIKNYSERGLQEIPARGGDAAITVAGAVAGWEAALKLSREFGGRLPLTRLLEDAIWYAKEGFPVSKNLSETISSKRSELLNIGGFEKLFLINGGVPEAGSMLGLPKLGSTLEFLSQAGLNDFYIGDVGSEIAKDLEKLGSPLKKEDFIEHCAKLVEPLSLRLSGGRVFNMPPPTQGLASLIILGILERLDPVMDTTPEFVHSIVEATKKAFEVRDEFITDPSFMTVSPKKYLSEVFLDQMAEGISSKSAAPWPNISDVGDTVWLGAADSDGCVVSFIQSIYWEFGSGVVLPGTGITWQNRGKSFSLDAESVNALLPRKKPFHTIQPALAFTDDGDVLSYGCMGGDGQPQTQAMLYSRIVGMGQGIQEAITAPRWLLGRTWGDTTTKLRIEGRFPEETIQRLSELGHELEVLDEFDEITGHAGAVRVKSNGLIEGGGDPRSDGLAAGF